MVLQQKTYSNPLGKTDPVSKYQELRCYALISWKCSFTSGVLPDERIVSRYMEQSRRITVGLISWHWLHHPYQLPPVVIRESHHWCCNHRSTVKQLLRLRSMKSHDTLVQYVHFDVMTIYVNWCVFTDASSSSQLTSSPTSVSSIHPWRCSLQTPATSIPPACRWMAVWPRWWAPASAGSWSLFLQGKKIQNSLWYRK